MKKKKYRMLLVVACMMAGILGACGNQTTQTSQSSQTSQPSQAGEGETSQADIQQETTKDVEETKNDDQAATKEESSTEQEKQPDSQDNSASAGGYTEVLDRCYTAVKENWDYGKLLEEGMSVLYTGNTPDNIGYSFADINNDGTDELVIGVIAGDEFTNQMIFEMYTLENNTPVQIFAGQERDRYYLLQEEAGGYLIANEASMGAGNSGWYYDRLDGKELSVVQAIIYDSVTDEANPWYMAYDDDWDVTNDSPIEEELAESIIESYEKQRILPEYTAFSQY